MGSGGVVQSLRLCNNRQGAAENMTAHVMLPRVSWTTSVQNDGQTSWFLTHSLLMNLAVANTKRSRHLSCCRARPLSRSPWCRGTKDRELFVHKVGLRREPKARKGPPTSSGEDHENQSPPESAFDAFGLGGRAVDGVSSFLEQ